MYKLFDFDNSFVFTKGVLSQTALITTFIDNTISSNLLWKYSTGFTARLGCLVSRCFFNVHGFKTSFARTALQITLCATTYSNPCPFSYTLTLVASPAASVSNGDRSTNVPQTGTPFQSVKVPFW